MTVKPGSHSASRSASVWIAHTVAAGALISISSVIFMVHSYSPGGSARRPLVARARPGQNPVLK